MSKYKPKKILRQLFIVVSGLSFVWFSAASIIKLLTTPEAEKTKTPPVESPEAKLEKELAGYKLVLQREPKNRFALEKIVEIYLAKGNLQEASLYMERLVNLEPSNQNYKRALEAIRQGLREKQPQKQSKPGNSSTTE
ncbi:MAG: hypothetical protein NZ901_08340 [Geminocystis sp.]|nr:hypothetical protein [Geminocystis sp.]HIK36538.1 hypothetical protein [Geminocystis sp. M7585_C2015_104]MCS7148182.1 hypothetical protein [Geminocystis sp.]MCX8077595.1 hypothetical protein [Geminocystis sp.]MDW8117261.1 hypothetical protein [Geminocystis sp.]